jgi:hypothetical protein
VIRIAIVAAALLVQSSGALDAQPLTCSTWQGIRTCSSSDGYLSQEWNRDGMTIGNDNQGDRWTTSRWRDMETTTVEQPRAR